MGIDDADTVFQVVTNEQDQYSIWFADRAVPAAGPPTVRPARSRNASSTSSGCGPTCVLVRSANAPPDRIRQLGRESTE